MRLHRSVRPVVVVTAALALVGALASSVAAGPAPRAQAAAKSVTVGDNFFKPNAASIGKGGSVTWRWRGKAAHNVTFTSGSGRPRNCSTQQRGACTRKFARKGTYGYVCTIHSGMAGRIKVN